MLIFEICYDNDLGEVAVLGAALNICVSVSTAVLIITSAVVTSTKMVHWL
jgi:hypothetical protein